MISWLGFCTKKFIYIYISKHLKSRKNILWLFCSVRKVVADVSEGKYTKIFSPKRNYLHVSISRENVLLQFASPLSKVFERWQTEKLVEEGNRWLHKVRESLTSSQSICGYLKTLIYYIAKVALLCDFAIVKKSVTVFWEHLLSW